MQNSHSRMLNTKAEYSWHKSLPYRNQSIDLLNKPMNCFLHDWGATPQAVNPYPPISPTMKTMNFIVVFFSQFLNPFHTNVWFIYLVKMSKNLWCFKVFMKEGVGDELLTWYGSHKGLPEHSQSNLPSSQYFIHAKEV